MKSIVYRLKIYEPGRHESWQTFEASQPFLAFNVGDHLSSLMWPAARGDLRVVNIRHNIWQPESGGNIMHDIEVFTEEVIS